MNHRSLLLTVLAALPASAQEKLTYQDHVRPIFENRCLNCHNPDKKKGGLDLSTFSAAMAGGSGGVCLEPGDPQASKLFKSITHAAEPFMPPKSDKLPQAELDVIAKWITGGVLETASSTAKVKKKSDFAMAAGADTGKPDGPPAMPEHLLLDPVVSPPRSNCVKAFAHSPWAPLLAVAAPRQVLLYHSATRELLGVLPFPDGGSPECVRFTRNGALVLAGGGTAGKKGLVAAWDVKTGRRVITLGEEFDSVLSADITPDYRKIALGGPGRKLRIYDTASGQKLHEIKKHTDWITAVAFSPDGVLLASGDRNGGLFVWETATGGEFYNLKGHEKMIAALAWRADSNLVASGSEDGTWIWWEMQNGGQVKRTGSHGGVLCLGFAPDGTMVSGGRDGHARTWDPGGNQKRDWTPSGGALVLSTVFSGDGKNVVTGSWNGDIKVWDAAKDGNPLGELAGNPPSLESRIESANKEVAAKQTEVEKARATMAEKEKAVTAMKAESEALKKSIAGVQAQMDGTAKSLESVKSEMAKMEEAKKSFAAGIDATRKQIESLAAAPAPKEVPAGMPGQVAEVLKGAAEAEKSLNVLTRSVLENKLTMLTATLTRYDAELTARHEKLHAGGKEIATLRSKMDEMAKAMPEKERLMAEAQKAVEALKPAIDAALAAVAAPQQVLTRWLAARENKSVLALRDELAALKESIDSLKAEIPALESDLKTITEKKTAVPPPAAADLEKLDAKLSAAQKRIEAAKSELAAAESGMAEKQKALDERWQKYLAMLPKAQ